MERQRKRALRFLAWKRLGRDRDSDGYLTDWDALLQEMTEAADTDDDGIVTVDEFDETGDARFYDDHEWWDTLVDKLLTGQCDDPYPGKDDSELSEWQRGHRARVARTRERALKYMAYRRAQAAESGGEQPTFDQGMDYDPT